MDQSRTELDELRARAYGPGADIAADRGALARLRELEAAARAAARPVPVAAPAQPAAVASEAIIESVPPAPSTSASPAPPVEDALAATARPGWRRWLWPASVVATAAVAVGLTYAVGVPAASQPSLDEGVRLVDTVPAGSALEWPEELTGWGSVGPRFEYHGLAIAGISAADFDVGDRCLSILSVRSIETYNDSDGFVGPMFGGCGAGGFPAAVVFRVSDELPAEFRERFPAGAAVQFVLDGERLRVLTDAD